MSNLGGGQDQNKNERIFSSTFHVVSVSYEVDYSLLCVYVL